MVAFELCTDNKQDAPFALLPAGHIIHGFQKEFLHFDWSDQETAGGLPCICGCNKELCSLTMVFELFLNPAVIFTSELCLFLLQFRLTDMWFWPLALTYKDFYRFFKFLMVL